MPPFSLAALLRLKRLQQDRDAAEVSISRTRAIELAARRRHAEHTLGASGSPSGHAETLRWIAAARAASSSTLGDLSALQDASAHQLAEAEAQLAASRAQTITLEKLEARHDAAALHEELRREQNALDEIAPRPSGLTGKPVTR